MAIKDKYDIERNYISNPIARSREPIEQVKFIVDHETANNTATADNHQAYFDNIDFPASAHTFVDDSKILEIIPLDEKAWHVRYDKPKDNEMYGSDSNDAAIGIELCRTGDFDKAYDKYVWYNAYLCHKFGLKPGEHIVAHSVLDPQRRSDPQSWLEPNGISWDEFIDDVQAYYDNWNGEAAKKTYEPKERRAKAEVIVKQEEYSVVDYLNARGRNSSFGARKKLADQYGIKGYKGTAEQNLRLLDLLKHEKVGGKETNSKPSPKSSKLPTGILRRGDSGADVRKVQEALASVYYYPNKDAPNNGVDGIYGPNTEDAVRRFQSMYGLVQDGIYGPNTRAKLIEVM